MMFDAHERTELIELARTSIESGLAYGELRPPAARRWSEALDARRSCFVTLRLAQELRGCCGSLDAERPLAIDVWRNAWASAFSDPRFAPLTRSEWPRCDVHISVLTTPEPIAARTEQAVLEQLRPHVDGLILQLGAARATFLPAVWEQAADPLEFVRHLKLKAGWRADFWSPHIQAWRYQSDSIGEHDA